MQWQEFYLKGKRVWVALDDGEFPVDDKGQAPIRYEKSTEATAYKTYPERLCETREASLDEWQTRLEELEDELETREKKLRRREKAVQEWEGSLKDEAIEGEALSSRQPTDDSEKTMSSGTAPDFIDVTQLGPDRDITVAFDPPADVSAADAPVGDIIEIYTDGACSGNPGPCGYGFVARRNDEYAEGYEFLGEGTNNIAELEGIRSSLAAITDRDAPIRVYSDSRYAIGVLSKGWNAKANRELILDTRELLDEFSDVQLRKVEGHAGHALNERADDLAKQAIP